MTKRRHPNKKEQLTMYAHLHKIPVEPPCDSCPWRLYPDKVQGCDNCDCGFMAIYAAVNYYQRVMGYWPHAGDEVKNAIMSITTASNLLTQLEQQKGDYVK